MYDVIVVGARCSGSALALLLARLGYRILLVDRDTFPSDMPRSTHFVHQRGVACLNRWNLRDRLAATGSPPVTRAAVDVGDFALAGVLPPVDGETEAFAPRRLLLDQLLVSAAIENGVELYEGCRVERLRFEHGRVAGIRAHTRSGTAVIEHASLVVGADGPASRVAVSVRAEERHRRPALQGTAWRYWDGVEVAELEVYLRDFEGVYAFPTSCGTLVGANWSMERFRRIVTDLEEEYLELLRRAAPRLAAEVETATPADDRLYVGATRNYFRRAYGPGWALVGDAHYKKDPCTAQGITDAFCDAELLAGAIDEGLSGIRPIDELLADYAARTEERSLPFYDLTCQMATFSPPPPEMVTLYTALRSNQVGISSFLGLITEATSPSAFFAADNLQHLSSGDR